MTDAEFYREQAFRCWNYIDSVLKIYAHASMPLRTVCHMKRQYQSAVTFSETAAKCEELEQ